MPLFLDRKIATSNHKEAGRLADLAGKFSSGSGSAKLSTARFRLDQHRPQRSGDLFTPGRSRTAGASQQLQGKLLKASLHQRAQSAVFPSCVLLRQHRIGSNHPLRNPFVFSPLRKQDTGSLVLHTRCSHQILNFDPLELIGVKPQRLH